MYFFIKSSRKYYYCNIIILSVAFLIFFTLSAYSYQTLQLNKPVAKVNGNVITYKELAEAVNSLLPQSYYHKDISPQKRKELEKQALENLIREELFYREALKKGYKLSREEINKEFDKVIKKYPSEKAFRKALEKSKTKESDIRKKLEHIMLAYRFINDEVYKKAELKESDVLSYFNNNKSKFVYPESVKLASILIKVPPEVSKENKEKLKKKAEEAYHKIIKGEDFGKAAWNYSDDPSKVKGGNIGIIHRGRLEPEIEKVAFSLKKDEVSKVIKTIYGYYIVKVVEKYSSRQMKFEEVKEKLKKELQEKEIEKKVNKLVKSLKESSKIELFTN